MKGLAVKINSTGTQEIYIKNKSFLRILHIDLWLSIFVFILLILSSVLVYSASDGNISIIERHLTRIGFALILMIAVAQLSPTIMRLITPWVFIVGIIMLVSVLLVGDVTNGAKRWLNFGIFNFQPSELMKIILPLMVAWLYSYGPLPPSKKKLFLGSVIIIATAAIIVVEPDLGTALLIATSGFFVLFFSGLSWKLIIGMFIAVFSSLPIIWNFMHAYQKQRILTFLDPESSPLGSGYHIIQSKIAIGSGGLSGKGFMESTQARLNFLPESTTDFIFSVYAEEYGFVGVVSLLFVYLLIISRGLYIANQAQDNFTRLIASSFSMTLFVYVFVNIGMVSGFLPVVGVPLPLISYGGSAMVTLLISIGILMSIHTHKRMLSN